MCILRGIKSVYPLMETALKPSIFLFLVIFLSDNFNSSLVFQLFQSFFQVFWDGFQCSNSNEHKCCFYIPKVFQFSCKVLIFVYFFFNFFQYQPCFDLMVFHGLLVKHTWLHPTRDETDTKYKRMNRILLALKPFSQNRI